MGTVRSLYKERVEWVRTDPPNLHGRLLGRHRLDESPDYSAADRLP
jgi:hypothetical protein